MTEEGLSTSLDRTTFAPPTLMLSLRALSVAPCGLIPRMYLCIAVDLVRDMGSDQWAIGVLFDCLFNASLDFL